MAIQRANIYYDELFIQSVDDKIENYLFIRCLFSVSCLLFVLIIATVVISSVCFGLFRFRFDKMRTYLDLCAKLSATPFMSSVLKCETSIVRRRVSYYDRIINDIFSDGLR